MSLLHYNYKRNIFIIVSFCIISLISIVILMKCHVIMNVVDTQFHMKRISELNDSLAHGHFYFPFSFNQFNGSAVMILYPYINLLPISLLSFVCKSKITVINLYFLLQMFFGLNISYFSSLNFSKNRYTSYLFSVVYMLSNVFLGYYFSIMDLGAVSSYIFFPLVLFGFLDILIGENSYIKLALGMTFLVFSHIPSTLIAFLLLMVLLIINIRIINVDKVMNYIKSIILCILLTSIIWIPTSYFLVANKGIIHFTNPVMPKGIPINYFIKNSLGKADINGIGTIASIALILSLIFYKKFNRYIKQMYIISIFTVLICSPIIRWSKMPFIVLYIIKQFQFMYRFLIIPILFLSYIFSIIITKYLKKYNKQLFYLLIVISLIFQILGQVDIIHSMKALSVKPSSNYINYKMYDSKQINFITNKHPYGTNTKGIVTKKNTGADYLPKSSFSKLRYISNNIGWCGQKHFKFIHIGYNSFYFNTPQSIKNSNNVIIPLVIYNKDPLVIYDNNHLIRYHMNKNNLIKLNNVNKGVNKIKIVSIPNKLLLFLQILLLFIGLMWIFSRCIIKKIFMKITIKRCNINEI